ncbi:PQQ-dependent sugar dehydrogenase [Shewanella sp. AS16]|uniref:PQQ-dependent sugar dehydrogenase n=1 Tax=Shewanella sp. AS16 TaxID=2907625 RepID=UPI001F16E591|nr:PQQ-dependent sugar dehydrogenase [Shewanella sp. AS16]MCE9687043.1 PQQ-dependent sugar dehydrogenase [Shewanella sp. AS16]
MLSIKALNYINLRWLGSSLALVLLVSGQAYAGYQSIVITVTKGFGLTLYASELGDAKGMALGDEGTLFVGSGKSGSINALVDSDQDGRVDKRYLISDELTSPEAIAFHDGDLYVAIEDRILRYVDIEQRLRRPGRPKEIYSKLPEESRKGTRAMRFGPDGRLYVAIGAPCNVCESPAPFGSIIAIDVDTGDSEQIATGIRDVTGLDWSPVDGKLWFADKGRDWMGDNLPADEINRVDIKGAHYGFPYVHAKDVLEPAYDKPKNLKVTAPVFELPAHVAPTGMAFYRGKQFPEKYHQQLFVAENGSWNRSSKVGYQIVMLDVADNQVLSRHTVVSFLDGEFPVARPYAVINAPGGAMYISDDLKGNVYRLYYKGIEPVAPQEQEQESTNE